MTGPKRTVEMINQRSVSVSSVPKYSVAVLNTANDNDVLNRVGALKRKFWWFSVIASLNHALNYVVTSFATSLLSPLLGGVILGLNWSLNAVSGLTVATPIVRRVGFKYSMLISLWGYALQIGSMYIALVAHDVETTWIIAVGGGILAGFTSAVWWTAQGVYFEQICQAIDKELLTLTITGKSESNHAIQTIDSVRADLSAHWTIIYQAADIVVFLSLSLFPIFINVSLHTMILVLTILGFITALLGMTFESVNNDSRILSCAEYVEAIIAVPKQLCTDARVSLLAPFVFGFGITTAMLAGYVNNVVVSENLGTVELGFLEAFSYFIAIISAFPYAFVSNKFIQGQDWVIQFGSLAFMSCGIVVFAVSTDTLGQWPFILLLKGLYGLGRGVFEGSCRAVYAKMFTGDDLSTAFSGQTLSAGFSGGICFFIFGFISKDAISWITIGNGILALCSYFILMYLVDPCQKLSWRDLCSVLCGGKVSPRRQEESIAGIEENDFAANHLKSPLLAGSHSN